MCPVALRKRGPTPPPGWREQTYRQYLLLALLCHAGPPALHCFLFKKGHKPLRVESVIQKVQGALLGCLGRLGHAIEIQLQGACRRERFLNHGQQRLAGAGRAPQELTVTSSASSHGLSPWSKPSNCSSPSVPSYSLYTASY